MHVTNMYVNPINTMHAIVRFEKAPSEADSNINGKCAAKKQLIFFTSNMHQIKSSKFYFKIAH